MPLVHHLGVGWRRFCRVVVSSCRYDSSKTVDDGCEFGVGPVVNAVVSVAAGPTLNNYLFMVFALSFPGLVYGLNSNFLSFIMNVVNHRSTRLH